MSLTDNIHRLCRPHLATAPDGTLRHAPALLAELRAAVTPGSSMSGGGASGEPSPINLTAVDDLAAMEKDARADYREITGSSWAGDLESLLQHFANMRLTPEWHNYLERLTLEWVDQITAFLWPVKPRRKLVGKVCPSCGWAVYSEDRKTCLSLGCWDEDGGVRAIGTWDIECASCEAAWSGDQIAYLLTALDVNDTPTKKELTQVG